MNAAPDGHEPTPAPAAHERPIQYDAPVPIWWLFSLLYSAIIASNISFLVSNLASPIRVPLLANFEASFHILLFLTSMAVLISDWVWATVVLHGWPAHYPYYRRFHQISRRSQRSLLILHTLFIISYGISFSLLAQWRWTQVMFRAWDNPLLWFAISMLFSNAWDFVARISGLTIETSRTYYVFMGVITILPFWWLFEGPFFQMLTSYQSEFLLALLFTLALWRFFSLSDPTER